MAYVQAALTPEESCVPKAGWKGLVAERLQSAVSTQQTICVYFWGSVVY